MGQTELIVLLLAVVVGLGVLAQWLRIPYPILLVIGGLLLSLQPWAPRYELPPHVVLLVFLPPLLYAAAFNTEWSAFRTQLRSISLLAVGLVLFTTVLVAAACHYWLGLPWPVGFVLGAIVSPPDAVAATAITQRVKVPRIVATILEGESLVNDATALTVYKVGIAVALSGGFVWWEAAGQFAMVSAGGIAIGIIGAVLVIRIHRWLARTGLGDTKLNITLTLLTPYFVYLPAEHAHVSGVLAAVAAGLWVGNRCEEVFTHEFYIEARAVWEMLEFLLNGLIFILIGFQLPLILEGLTSQAIAPESLACGAVIISGVVIGARLLWVFPGAYVPRWVDRTLLGKGDPYPQWQSVLVVAWTGMRGVVSLAAAMALDPKFPHRDEVLFLTFWVIFATLVGQGLTLPLLIRVLGVHKFAAREATNEPENTSC